MKIVKSICHLGVDKMLKAALGDDLTIVRFRNKDGHANDINHWMGDEALPFEVSYYLQPEYDIKIIDDLDSLRVMKDVKAKHTIWYVHGTYHLWNDFHHIWNEQMGGVHVLFPDTERKKYVSKWYKHKPVSEIFLPIHLTDDYFTEMPKERNSLAYTIGNSLYKNCNIYGNMNIVDQVFHDLSAVGAHLYGFNDIAPPSYDKRLVMGAATPIKDIVKNYSVSVHPSFVGTFSFALLESLAAGVPAICTNKVSPYRKLCNIVDRPECFKRQVNRYMKDGARSLEEGARNQEIMRSEYSINSYREKLLEWISSLV